MGTASSSSPPANIERRDPEELPTRLRGLVATELARRKRILTEFLDGAADRQASPVAHSEYQRAYRDPGLNEAGARRLYAQIELTRKYTEGDSRRMQQK